jgi:hypothetical protein
MLRRVALVRTDVSEERSASIIRVTRIGEPILVTLMMEALRSYETSVLTRATRSNIPEDVILQYFINFTSLHLTKSYRCILQDLSSQHVITVLIIISFMLNAYEM